MFERFRKTSSDEGEAGRGGVATARREPEPVREADRARDADRVREAETSRFTRDPDAGATEDDTVHDIRTRQRGAEATHHMRARQREEFGGVNWGSAFFGWLVSVGMAAILLGLLSAAGAAFGLSEVSDAEAEQNAETIGIIGGILLILVLGVAYWCGGYVSGRMSRFDGGRQGLAVWALGLAVTVVLAVFGALFGAEYNVLERLNLPRIPIDEGSLTAGAAIALLATVLITMLVAVTGGKTGERYHKKVDRAGYTRL